VGRQEHALIWQLGIYIFRWINSTLAHSLNPFWGYLIDRNKGTLMTTPKVATIKRGGSRLYVHPETGDKVPGVTSVLDMLPKPFLKFWAAKLVAETAVDHAGSWIGMALAGDKQGAIDYLKRAPMRNTGAAAARGTDAHVIFEDMAGGVPTGKLHPDMEIFATHFQSFVDTFQPEFLHLEGTVWSDDPAYAGSFDWIAKIGDEVIIGDNKTTRSGVFPEVALQLNAYGAAPWLMDKDGNKTPMPELAGAAVLHIVPDGWQFIPVLFDRDKLMEVFTALIKVWQWDKSIAKTVIGDAIDPEEWLA